MEALRAVAKHGLNVTVPTGGRVSKPQRDSRALSRGGGGGSECKATASRMCRGVERARGRIMCTGKREHHSREGNYLFLCVDILVCMCTECLKHLWEETKPPPWLPEAGWVPWVQGWSCELFTTFLNVPLHSQSPEGTVSSSNTYNTT